MNKCSFEIYAEELESGEMKVNIKAEGNPILIGETLSKAVSSMENTDMDIIYGTFIHSQMIALMEGDKVGE